MSARKLKKGEQIIVASHNQGKVREIEDLLSPFGLSAISASTLNLPEPVEDGDSFIENAKIKALAAARASGKPSLSDDSGLAVDALGGNPGIFSARWAGPKKDFSLAMKRIEDELIALGATNSEARTAHFVCVLCMAWPDDHCEIFEGRVSGQMVWPPRGENGFGYDPVFQPLGHELTFGEMDASFKHEISHRADAFRQLKSGCLNDEHK